MTDQNVKATGVLAAIPTWWPVLAAVIGSVVIGAQAFAQIAEQGQRIADLEKAQPAIAMELRDVNVGIARLEGKIDTINEREQRRGG